MKTKEELNALKEEYEALHAKLAELTEEELKAVAGGTHGPTKRLGDEDFAQVSGGISINRMENIKIHKKEFIQTSDLNK